VLNNATYGIAGGHRSSESKQLGMIDLSLAQAVDRSTG
jgi:hypothetical protein